LTVREGHCLWSGLSLQTFGSQSNLARSSHCRLQDEDALSGCDFSIAKAGIESNDEAHEFSLLLNKAAPIASIRQDFKENAGGRNIGRV
jgi:hypothetical protein